MSLMEAFAWLQDELNLKAYWGLRRFDIQFSLFGSSSRYQRHVDSFSGAANRRATAIYYLNRDWVPPNGGCLRIHAGNSFCDIEPILNRLIVFRSDRLDHEVLEVFQPRLAITAWYYAAPD
jgi:SM-20-related protein